MPTLLAKAQAHLAGDPALGEVVRSTEINWTDEPGEVYGDLLNSICAQQLSGKAATTIYNRFLDLFPDRNPEATTLVSMEVPELRAAGLSRQKATYMQNIARAFLEDGLSETDWSKLDNEAVIAELTKIKGVGRWTVEMILMFSLRRPDILPVDDLGIQQGMMRLFDFEARGKALREMMGELAEPWRPYRTFASIYLWRWLG